MRRTVLTDDRIEHVILGEMLRDARTSAGLSQNALAVILDRTQAYVYRIEHAKQPIDIATLFDILDITKTNVGEFFTALHQDGRRKAHPPHDDLN